eukprot:659384-Prorocentrum_minimum.AAC.1
MPPPPCIVRRRTIPSASTRPSPARRLRATPTACSSPPPQGGTSDGPVRPHPPIPPYRPRT